MGVMRGDQSVFLSEEGGGCFKRVCGAEHVFIEFHTGDLLFGSYI